MDDRTIKELYMTALWWSVSFVLMITPYIIAVTIIDVGWMRFAALPFSIILTITFGIVTDKASRKEKVYLES